MLRNRVALGLAWAAVALAPLPLFIPSHALAWVVGALLALLGGTVVLCLATPREVPRRLRPLAIATFGLLAGTLFWHWGL